MQCVYLISGDEEICVGTVVEVQNLLRTAPRLQSAVALGDPGGPNQSFISILSDIISNILYDIDSNSATITIEVR